MTEYIIRENEPFKHYSKNEIEVGLIEFLEKEYDYIYQAMTEESYQIEYANFLNFFEITYENKVVGFYTTETIFDNNVNVCINEFYVVPEFRGNNIFLYQLINLIQTPNISVMIRKPSRNIVDILIKNGLAIEFADNLIFTYVQFVNEFKNVFVNNKLRKLYHTIDPEYMDVRIYGNVYDYKHCCTIFSDQNDIFAKKDTTPILSMPRKCDVDKYNLIPKLKKIDMKHVKKIGKEIKKNRDRCYELSQIIYLNIFSGLTVDNLIGNEDRLHEYVIELLEENNLTIEDGMEIRNKIQEALDEDEILPNTIRRRLEYLLKNPEKDALVSTHHDNDKCPYCDSDKLYDLESCESCGYNFYKDFEYDMLNDIVDNEREIDEKSGLEVSFLKTVDTNIYDLQYVFDAQFEIACIETLNIVDMFPNQPLEVSIEGIHHIKDDVAVKYLVENNLIEEKQNREYDNEVVYKITKKGRRYSKQNKIANLYSKNLQGFDYYKFKKYYDDNIENFKSDDVVENYIQSIENKALTENNYSSYNQILLNNILSSRNINGDKEFLINFIKSIICQLNEYKLTTNDKNDKLPIRFEMENHMALFDVIEEDYDLIELYVKAFNSIELEDLKINEEENLEIIQELAENKDLIATNFDIMEQKEKTIE